MPSDHVLLDIPHMEGLMYNIKYTYSFLVQFSCPYTGLSHVYFPILVWLTQEDIFAFLWLIQGQTVTQPVDSLSWCSCLSIIKTAFSLPCCWEKFSFLCTSCGRPPYIYMFLPKIDEDIALAHHLRAIFHCRGLLVQHTVSQIPGVVDTDLLHFQ